MEDQRRAAEAVEPHHLADEDHVVAAVVAIRRAAFESRRATGEQRHVTVAAFDGKAGEAVDAALGELVRDMLLVRRQDMNRKVLGGHKRRSVRRLAVEAPQHHRRIERDRVEAVGRQADVLALHATRGDHRDAGGERAQGLAELLGIDGRSVGHVLLLRRGFGTGASRGGRSVPLPRGADSRTGRSPSSRRR